MTTKVEASTGQSVPTISSSVSPSKTESFNIFGLKTQIFGETFLSEFLLTFDSLGSFFYELNIY